MGFSSQAGRTRVKGEAAGGTDRPARRRSSGCRFGGASRACQAIRRARCQAGLARNWPGRGSSSRLTPSISSCSRVGKFGRWLIWSSMQSRLHIAGMRRGRCHLTCAFHCHTLCSAHSNGSAPRTPSQSYTTSSSPLRQAFGSGCMESVKWLDASGHPPSRAMCSADDRSSSTCGSL